MKTLAIIILLNVVVFFFLVIIGFMGEYLYIYYPKITTGWLVLTIVSPIIILIGGAIRCFFKN